MQCVLKSGNSSPIKIPLRMLKMKTIARTKTTTIDAEQLKHFSDRMKTWWDPHHGPLKGLHSLNELRVPFIIDGLKESVADKNSLSLQNLNLLDVGCGGGVLSEALAKQGLKVTGIDASSDLINVAIQHSYNEAYAPTYHCTTIEDHVLKNANLYDAVVASEVIEHVRNQDLFVKSCVQALKPNGRVFFTTPSKTRISQLLNILFAENIVKMIPKGTHQYEKFISVEDLSLKLENHGCQIEKCRGFFFNMLANKWFWTENHIFFYALQAIKH